MNIETTNRRRDACHLRIKEDDVMLIDRAALVRGMTRSDFILIAAREAAQSALRTGAASPSTLIPVSEVASDQAR